MLNNAPSPASSRKGSTILEVLVATLVVGTMLTAIAASLTHSIKNSAEAEYRKVATRLAQESLEIFRKEKYIRTWTAFKALTPDVGPSWQCMSTDALNFGGVQATLTNCGAIAWSNPSSSFYRGYQKQTNEDDSVNIAIRVSWKDGAQVRSVDLEQTFREVVN